MDKGNAKDQAAFVLHGFKLAKIIRITRDGVSESFTEALISGAYKDGFDAYSQIPSPSAKKLTDNVLRDVLEDNFDASLEESLRQTGVLGLPTPYGGCGLTQAQWICFDDFYGGAIYGKDPIGRFWSRPILLILRLDRDMPPSSPSQVFPLTYAPDPAVMFYIDVAQVLMAISCIHQQSPIRVLVVSDQDTLFANLATYLLRDTDHPFSLVQFAFFPREHSRVINNLPATQIKTPARPKVFISYANEDLEHADRLYKDLQRHGAEPFLDRKNLLPGQRWPMELFEAIKNADYAIALLSSHSVSKKGYVQKELKLILEVQDRCPPGKPYLLPVRLDSYHMPYPEMEQLHWIDLFGGYDDCLSKLLKVIKSS